MTIRKAKRHKVLLIASAGDQRERFHFLLRPLHRLTEVKTTFVLSDMGKPLGLIKYIHTMYRHKGASAVIFVGAGPAASLWYVLNALFVKAPFVLRLGGALISQKIAALTYNKHLGLTQRFKLRISISLNRWLVKKTKYFIIVNRNIQNELDRYAGRDVQAFIIPQCINPVIPGRHPWKLNKRDIQILTVSNYKYKDKFTGTVTLMQMLREFLSRTGNDSHVTFNICGGGYYLAQLQEIARSLAYENLRIILHGFVSNTADYYRKANLFVYSSTFDGLPNVLLEAQAHGLPIMVNDFSAFRALLEEGVNALFFDPENKQSFFDAFSRLTGDEDLRRFLSHNNIGNIDKNYSSRAISLQIRDMLGILAAKKIGIS